MNNLHILRIITALRDGNITKKHTLRQTTTDKNMSKIEKMMRMNDSILAQLGVLIDYTRTRGPWYIGKPIVCAVKLADRASVLIKCLSSILFFRYTRLRKLAQRCKKDVLIAQRWCANG